MHLERAACLGLEEEVSDCFVVVFYLNRALERG